MLSQRRLKNRFPQWLFAMVLAVVLAGAMNASAVAQEKEADLSVYCVATYGAGTISGFDRRDNGPLCSERTHQGLGLLHHKVDPAAVCSSQHSTSRYRKEGPRILCLSGDATTDSDRKVDLADHCRHRYGDTAIVSRRLTDKAPLCTVKGSGGLSQIHHVIDLSELCGHSAGPEAMKEGMLDCSEARKRADSGTSGRGGAARKDPAGPSSDSKAGKADGKETVPATAIVRHADKPDLRGCGISPGKELVELGYEFPLAPANWEKGVSATPCNALTDGFKPDLDSYCAQHHAGMKAGWLPNGRPICHPPEYFPTGPEANGYWMILPSVCNAMYPQREALRRGKINASGKIEATGRLYPLVKLNNRQLECFYLDVSPDEEFELKLMEAAHGDVRGIKDGITFFGGPFFYDVIYPKKPDEPVRVVTVESADGRGTDLVLKLAPLEDSDRIFRSEPFYIEVPDGDSSPEPAPSGGGRVQP